jgi:hypothetical protein
MNRTLPITIALLLSKQVQALGVESTLRFDTNNKDTGTYENKSVIKSGTSFKL